MADKKFFKSIKRRRMINIMKYMYIYAPSKKTDKYNNRLVDKKLTQKNYYKRRIIILRYEILQYIFLSSSLDNIDPANI